MFKTRLPASLTTAKASGKILSNASFSKILSAFSLSEVGRASKIFLNSAVFPLSSSSESFSNSGSKAFIWSIIPNIFFTFFSFGSPNSFNKKFIIIILSNYNNHSINKGK